MKKLSCIVLSCLLLGCSYATFVVTEIFIDGSQEYIEIQNQGVQAYSGILFIEGINSSIVEITTTQALLPNEYILISDASVPFEHRVCQLFDSNALSFTDSKGVDITLSRSTGSSSMHIDKDTVVSIDNEKRSLVFNNGNYIPIHNSQSINITQGYYGSPCYGDLEMIDIGEDDEDIVTSTGDAQNNNQSPTLGTGTGIEGSGAILTGNSEGIDENLEEEHSEEPQEDVLPPDTVSSINDDSIVQQCSSDYIPMGSLSIRGVSPKNSTLSDEFIMIESLKYFSGDISLIGGGRGGATITHQITVYPGIPILIAKSDRGFSNSYRVVVDESLSLTDSGETVRISHDGVIHDEIYWDESMQDVVLFGNDDYSGTPRHLDVYGTLHTLFSSYDGIGCDFILDGNTLRLLSSALCELPGDSYRYDQSQTSSTECEEGIEKVTTSGGQYSFIKKIGETVICSNTLTIQGSQENNDTTSDTHESDEMYLTGSNMSGGVVTITEISPRSGIFPEYIEIQVSEGVHGEIEITGLGQGSASKNFSVTGPNMYVVTKELIPSIPRYYQIIIDSISLTDGGETLEVRHGGQLMDTISYSGTITENTSRNRISLLSTIQQELTPGFLIESVQHLLPSSGEKEFDCSIRIQNTDTFTSENKLNLVASVDSKDITNTSSQYSCVWNFDGLYSSSSEYDETSRCNPGYLQFPEAGVYGVQVVITDSLGSICSIESSINAPEVVESTSSGSNEGKSGYYQGLYQKRKERFMLLKSNIKPFGLSSNASGSIVTLTNSSQSKDSISLNGSVLYGSGIVDIIKVLPNPIGSDKDNEKIVLRNSSQESFSTLGRRIHSGKSSKKLPEVVLEPGVETLIVGSLGLVNSNRCISILSPEDEYHDTFCYGKAEDDQRFDVSNQTIQNFVSDQGGLIDINDFSLTIHDTESCLEYEGSSLLCKPLPVDKQSLKQLKSDAKKYLSIQKKYDTELERRKKYQQQLTEQKSKTTQVRKDYQKKLKNEKLKSSNYYADVKNQKRLATIYRGLIGIRGDLLQDEYSALFMGSSFETAWNAYRDSLDLFYQNKPLHYGPISLQIADVDILSAYLGGEPSLFQGKEIPSSVAKQIVDALLYSN